MPLFECVFNFQIFSFIISHRFWELQTPSISIIITTFITWKLLSEAPQRIHIHFFGHKNIEFFCFNHHFNSSIKLLSGHAGAFNIQRFFIKFTSKFFSIFRHTFWNLFYTFLRFYEFSVKGNIELLILLAFGFRKFLRQISSESSD